MEIIVVAALIGTVAFLIPAIDVAKEFMRHKSPQAAFSALVFFAVFLLGLGGTIHLARHVL